ncbi:glycoside hydrolase family 95 protein [Pontiella sulfatireligans]|uniref:Uncharacterized protein n=1 Tax=Pontiella sulfatireligans TaxID=2750658 RepID=A0A6C2UFM8_9BACT|nr:glycoside hydrolase family 95 protein [Pontiella sulfatireligans]VGO18729.1 hypothetical protein SCARR_00782 [Pontiella sulfatireligans]
MANLRIAFAILTSALGLSASGGDLKLWYDAPAEEWTGGLPLGNGRLMAVVQGGIAKETIQLNDDTMWTGQPVQRDKPGAYKHLGEVRRLFFEGRNVEGEKLMQERMQGLVLSMGMSTYQTSGDLKLNFRHDGKATGYRRELDLRTAIASVSYNVDGTNFTREVFVSPVDQALVVRLSSDKAGALSFDAELARPRGDIKRLAPDQLSITGVAKPKTNPGWIGVDYETRLQVSAENGTLNESKNGIRVEGADAVTLRLVTSTNYRGEDPAAVCEKQLSAAVAKSYTELRNDHVSEHQRLFNRVDLNLGAPPGLPTDKRLEAFRGGAKDPSLVSLYFQFGRYLLISASRPDSMCINLWGKWVNGLEPAYDADYHININIQMNYWLAEMCNLSECHEPFFDLLDNLRPRGRITAKEMYNCGGFTANYATDAWLFTSSIGNAPYGIWPMAPAWMCNHLWEHYLFGGDKEYLRNRSYPIMKEACEFMADYLVEHPKTGYMVSGPSTSPENRYKDPKTGKSVSISMAPAMDTQLITDLFDNTIVASKLLGKDRFFRKKLVKLRARLMPMQIGEDGRLLEWAEPYEEGNKGHRHISHLWAVCPGNQITENTPELFEAARKSLEVRVEHGAADSPEYQGIAAWVMCAYTRLLDGEKSYGLLKHILSNSSWDNLFAVGERGRTREMFETDVNFGATSAIAEMMLQSHDGTINLLPALPLALPDGSVSGLVARGGFEVSIDWKNGKLKRAVIISLRGNHCRLKLGNQQIDFETEAGQEYVFSETLEQN